jgi:hypothetical protein
VALNIGVIDPQKLTEIRASVLGTSGAKHTAVAAGVSWEREFLEGAGTWTG